MKSNNFVNSSPANVEKSVETVEKSKNTGVDYKHLWKTLWIKWAKTVNNHLFAVQRARNARKNGKNGSRNYPQQRNKPVENARVRKKKEKAEGPREMSNLASKMCRNSLTLACLGGILDIMEIV